MASCRLTVVAGHLQPNSSHSQGIDIQRAGMSRPPITTHVLDTALGKPAEGVPIELCRLRMDKKSWEIIGSGVTNSDGRCSALISTTQMQPGTYRMHFDTAAYFATQNNLQAFYPYAEIVFTVYNTAEHYHIPLLLSPYAYSTYRGS